MAGASQVARQPPSGRDGEGRWRRVMGVGEVSRSGRRRVYRANCPKAGVSLFCSFAAVAKEVRWLGSW